MVFALGYLSFSTILRLKCFVPQWHFDDFFWCGGLGLVLMFVCMTLSGFRDQSVWECVWVLSPPIIPQHPWPMQPAHDGRSWALWASSCHHRSRCTVEHHSFPANTQTPRCDARWPRYLELSLTHTDRNRGETIKGGSVVVSRAATNHRFVRKAPYIFITCFTY